MSKPILGYEPGPEADDADTTYRYVVDGEVIREFKDEPTALIYFDEDRENCIKIATEHNINMKRSILDDTGYRTVTLISDLCKPAAPVRQKFVRVDRQKLCTSCAAHAEKEHA